MTCTDKGGGGCSQLEAMGEALADHDRSQLSSAELSSAASPRSALRSQPSAPRRPLSTAIAAMSRTLEEKAVGEEEEQAEKHYDEVEKLQVRDSSGSSGRARAAAAAEGPAAVRSAAAGSSATLSACSSLCLPSLCRRWASMPPTSRSSRSTVSTSSEQRDGGGGGSGRQPQLLSQPARHRSRARVSAALRANSLYCSLTQLPTSECALWLLLDLQASAPWRPC